MIGGTKFKVVEHPPDLKILKQCLKELPGKNILTIEKTTTAQWLYVELKDYEPSVNHFRLKLKFTIAFEAHIDV